MSAPDGGKRGASRSGIPKGANEHGDSRAAPKRVRKKRKNFPSRKRSRSRFRTGEQKVVGSKRRGGRRLT